MLAILTVLNGSGEVLGLMLQETSGQTEIRTPLVIKASKDLLGLFWLLWLLLLWSKNTKIRVGFTVLTLVLLATFAGILTATVTPLLLLPYLRWLLPVVVGLLAAPYIGTNTIVFLAKVLLPLLLFHVALQVVQYFIGVPWFGTNQWGFASRSPGLFFLPSPGSQFSIVSWVVIYWHHPNKTARILTTFVLPVSVFLANSGTGVALIVLLFTIALYGRKYLVGWLVSLPVIAVMGAAGIVFLTSRGATYVSTSLGRRLQNLGETLADGALVSAMAGSGTNTGVLLTQHFGLDLPFVATDSTYPAIVANVGIVALLFVLVGMAQVFIRGYLTRQVALVSVVVSLSIIALPLNISETFPHNYLIALLLGHHLLGKPLELSRTNAPSRGTVELL